MLQPPARPRRRSLRLLMLVTGVAALVVAGLTALWSLRPRLTDEEVDAAVLMTLTEEAEASFLVTGTLTFGTTIERERRRQLRLPYTPFEATIGRARVTVEVPGRVGYGFDVRFLRAEDIRLAEDGAVEVDLPPLTVFSVEPVLEQARMRTRTENWAMVDREMERQLTQNTLGQVRLRMRQQAERHLAESDQSRVNAAEAVARTLGPPLEAAGLEDPRFRIRFGNGMAVEAGGAGGLQIETAPER